MTLPQLPFTSRSSPSWREWTNSKRPYRSGYIRAHMWPVFDFERACLTGLVLKTCDTAQSLLLPTESAPILAMAELSWPCLQDLSLHGHFLVAMHAVELQHLLSSLPSLRILSTLTGKHQNVGWQRILPEPSSSTSLMAGLNSSQHPGLLPVCRLPSAASPTDLFWSMIVESDAERPKEIRPVPGSRNHMCTSRLRGS